MRSSVAKKESVRVLFRDEWLIAVDKPSGLLVHRGWANDRVSALSEVRALAGCHVHPLHRLDRGTSGVLLFALDPVTARALSAAFENGHVEKSYVALVRGRPPDAGVIDHPIPKTEGGARVDARTCFRRLASVERFSLVEARPETGRLHQIRRHLKHAGHPIVGDVNYGRGEINRWFREHAGLSRLALHAASLRFVHPRTGAVVFVEAPLPSDMADALDTIGMPSELVVRLRRASG